MTLYKRILIACSLFIFYACCKDQYRGPSPLPYLTFSKSPPAVSTDTAVTFTRIYALKGKRNLYDLPSDFPRSTFQVPLALGSDSTTYIFEGSNSIDTLTLAYTRKVQFVSRNCGAYLSIQNIHISEPTSFSNVKISTDSSALYSSYDYDFVVVINI